MYLSRIRIENFRLFGADDAAVQVDFRPGVTALVGENDSGKTAIVDAIRLILGTRDQESLRVAEEDFHLPRGAIARATDIRLSVRFDDLSQADAGALAEYLTFEDDHKRVLWLHWTAKRRDGSRGARWPVDIAIRSGKKGDGPTPHPEARDYVCATYLRPLRDADRAMAAGRRSRLSQILQNTAEITSVGQPFDPAAPRADPSQLSVVGIGDFANTLLQNHGGVRKARERLNDKYLANLAFAGNPLKGHISVQNAKDDARLRQLLEKLELDLRDDDETGTSNRGLGSNNLLFIACELLLLGDAESSAPLLIIEEPEAHLHPQRQLRLISFLNKQQDDGNRCQVIVTTHSPYLASLIDLNDVVVVRGGKAFGLAKGLTALDEGDYALLSRFLDATKANMLFARGVLIVEGDAEHLLLPTIAKLIGRDLALHGVSIVNVGGVGLGRYARIYQRAEREHPGMGLRIACLTDMDVMPNCAPVILGLKETARRRWRMESDFTELTLAQRRLGIEERAAGQGVKTFPSDFWTLEYDLAVAGLEAEICRAVRLAMVEDAVAKGDQGLAEAEADADMWYEDNIKTLDTAEERATRIYQLLRNGVSKPAVAQQLARVLSSAFEEGRMDAETLRLKLPAYIIGAIEHVTLSA